MDNMKCIRGLQYLLAIYGYDMKLFISAIPRISLFILRIVFFVAMILNIVWTITITNFHISASYVILILPNVDVIIFFTVIWFQMSKMCIFISRISSNMSMSDISSCSKVSYLSFIALLDPLICTITSIITIDRIIALYDNFWGWNMTNEINSLIAIVHQIYFLVANSWPALSTALYVISSYVHMKYQMNMLTNMKNSLCIEVTRRYVRQDTGYKVYSMKSYVSIFDEIFETFSMFENIFSFIPFIQLADLFEAFSRIIIMYKMLSLPVLYVTLTLDAISALVLLYFIDYFKCQMNTFIDELRQEINSISNIDLNVKMFINMNLDKCMNQKYSAFGMFNIEISLLLSFTSALVSFTILFLSTA